MLTKILQNAKRVFINICDFVEAKRRPDDVFFFASRDKLRDYSLDTDRIFPLKAAKKDTVLHGILINMVRQEGEDDECGCTDSAEIDSC